MTDELLTITQVADMLNMPVKTLYWWRTSCPPIGPLSFTLGPRIIRYRRADVDAWFDAQYARAVGDPLPTRGRMLEAVS